jgi:hypothetical protein
MIVAISGLVAATALVIKQLATRKPSRITMPLKVKSWVIEANRLKGPTHLPLWSLQNSLSERRIPLSESNQ